MMLLNYYHTNEPLTYFYGGFINFKAPLKWDSLKWPDMCEKWAFKKFPFESDHYAEIFFYNLNSWLAGSCT